MAFRQHHRPQPSRQLSFHSPERPAEVGPVSSPQRKRSLEESEEWVLFSPIAPESTTTRTQTTSTERTPRTAGLSRLSDFGSLDTAARSDQSDNDDITCQGTEAEEGEDLDSLDDGLHAFHEPSEYGASASRLQQSGDTVLPTHDGLGTFQPGASMQEHLWQFERQAPRRRHTRRRSSVQRRLDALEEAEEVNHEHDRRQRIERWRLEQSRALLEEIERESRRRRRMSMVSVARSRTDSAHQDNRISAASRAAASISDSQSESSDDSTENLSFWQRLTRRVIRDLMGIDEDTLSVIFGESLPEEALSAPQHAPELRSPAATTVQALDISTFPGEPWEHRLLERVARELGILVHQLSEHPGAFSAYRSAQEAPEYAGITSSRSTSILLTDVPPLTTPQSSIPSPTAALFAPSLPNQQASNMYSEASLWGIEEEPEADPLVSFHVQPPAPIPTVAEEMAREREYWERELDVKMVFNFLVKRFSSRRSSVSSQTRRSMSAPPGQPRAATAIDSDSVSARRAAIIRQHHPLVSIASRTADRVLPSSSNPRENRRKELIYRHQTSLRNQVLRSSSSCASQSTKKSKRSAGSGRNYWDLGGSASGSVLAVITRSWWIDWNLGNDIGPLVRPSSNDPSNQAWAVFGVCVDLVWLDPFRYSHSMFLDTTWMYEGIWSGMSMMHDECLFVPFIIGIIRHKSGYMAVNAADLRLISLKLKLDDELAWKEGFHITSWKPSMVTGSWAHCAAITTHFERTGDMNLHPIRQAECAALLPQKQYCYMILFESLSFISPSLGLRFFHHPFLLHIPFILYSTRSPGLSRLISSSSGLLSDISSSLRKKPCSPPSQTVKYLGIVKETIDSIPAPSQLRSINEGDDLNKIEFNLSGLGQRHNDIPTQRQKELMDTEPGWKTHNPKPSLVLHGYSTSNDGPEDFRGPATVPLYHAHPDDFLLPNQATNEAGATIVTARYASSKGELDDLEDSGYDI
ncbi:uncharacterized protein BDR25DRAFT_348198 [Lindgomyces ingoldianus]|uniref:Uncharacterized protein n=1 Tax=Lindgomyces ingoldianus TaxID=673940 RepID=A0ACB6RHT8_9PLEO|nr:uncharacterized protein BDR25DRAFT_348198 [Lindgomyces ingoldianus]KAF2477890.1 hypothetical protein BDR25DRAFT_348198 [Lindgomyces ingoldianus]